MKVLRKLLLVSLAGAMFAACSKDPETVDPIGPVTPEEGVEIAPVSVSLVVPGMTAPVTVLGARTRAEGEEAVSVSVPQETEVTRAGDTSATAAESAIKNLWILQFNGNGNLAFKALFENVTASTLNVSLLGFDKTTVYAIANVGKDKFANTAIGSLTLTQLEAMKFTAATGSVLATTDTNPTIADGLPMIGSWTGQTKDPSIASGQPKIDLVRLVAKVVFTYSIEVPDGHSFDFHVFRMVSQSTETSYKAPAAGSIAPAATAKFVDESGWSNPGPGKTYTWYLCENLRGTNTAITTPADKGDAKAPEHSTYIEITGLYNDGTDEYEVIYHIYLGKNNTDDFNIQRNHKYTVHATIKGNNAADSRLIVATDLCKNPWSTAQVETANSYMVSKAGRTYKFKATVQGNGKKTDASSISGQNAPEIKPVALSPKSVKVLWETIGSKKIIKDVFLKDGWVYLTTAGEIGDPVTEGNALIAVYSAENVGKESESNVLWSWHIWSTSYVPSLASSNTHRTREITTAGYNKVAAHNISVMNRNLGAANNEVGDVKSFGLLYQWGRKDPFVGASSAAAGTTSFAASTKGQSWGTSVFSASSTPEANIKDAIAHPTTFYTQVNGTSTKQYDWVGDSYANQRDNLWGNPNGSTQTPNTVQGSKSIYDPCPPGWRVAPQDTWTMFTKNGINTSTSSDFNVSGGFNVGWKFYYETTGGGATVYYPAAGYRHREAGALTAVGEGGWWWSSSSYAAGSASAGNLGFNSGVVNPLNNSSRAYGFSVRCVQN